MYLLLLLLLASYAPIVILLKVQNRIYLSICLLDNVSYFYIKCLMVLNEVNNMTFHY